MSKYKQNINVTNIKVKNLRRITGIKINRTHQNMFMNWNESLN